MFLLRIEDIDPARKRTEFVDGIIGDLLWLGLEPDGAIVSQSERLSLYAAALERLKEHGLAYPCFCTRRDISKEIAARAQPPHRPDAPLLHRPCPTPQPHAPPPPPPRADHAYPPHDAH